MIDDGVVDVVAIVVVEYNDDVNDDDWVVVDYVMHVIVVDLVDDVGVVVNDVDHNVV